jgi:hypothetical protein
MDFFNLDLTQFDKFVMLRSGYGLKSIRFQMIQNPDATAMYR